MGSQAEYDNFLRRSSELASQFGPNWMQRTDIYDAIGPDGTMVARAGDFAKGANPRNLSGSILQKKPSYSTYNADGEIVHDSDEGIEDPQGWDRQFGHLYEWNPDDVLPTGQKVSDYLGQLSNIQASGGFGAPISSSNAPGMSVGGFLKNAISSPGIASVLGLAGIGGAMGAGGPFSFLNGGGGAGASSWTNGFDLAGGGALDGMGAAAPGWISGFDLPMGGGGGMDWTSGFDLPMGGGSDWTSGFDLPGGGDFSTTGTGTTTTGAGNGWTSGYDLPGGGALGGGAGGAGGAGSLIQQLMSGLTGPMGGGAGTGIPNLLSSLAGLFDLAGTGPLSARGINERAAETADPFMKHRGTSGSMLMNLMQNPGSFNLTPGAQFTMKMGTENLTRSNAARGLAGSGNILADIMKYGEGVASEDYYKTVDRLLPMSGATTGNPAAAGGIQSGLLNSRNSALANIGGGLAPVPGNSTNTGGGVLQALGGIGSGIKSIFDIFKG